MKGNNNLLTSSQAFFNSRKVKFRNPWNKSSVSLSFSFENEIYVSIEGTKAEKWLKSPFTKYSVYAVLFMALSTRCKMFPVQNDVLMLIRI